MGLLYKPLLIDKWSIFGMVTDRRSCRRETCSNVTLASTPLYSFTASCVDTEATTAYKLCPYCRHNDLAWNVRNFVHNQLQRFNFSADLRTVTPWATSSWSHTDLPRMQQGMLGAQVLTTQFVFLYATNGLCRLVTSYAMYLWCITYMWKETCPELGQF